MKRTPFVHISLLVAFLFNSIITVPIVFAQELVSPQAGDSLLVLPKPGVMVHLSPPENAAMLKGIKVNPNNPFRFEFILDKGDVGNGLSPLAGDSHWSKPFRTDDSQLKEESTKLIKYFLASLTIPEKDLWVNLSPYEKDRIVPESFGLTEMGRDLLAQDYMLKQVTASLIYPEDEIGKRFWKRIYEQASIKYGTTNIPVNTFNKVWIVPEKAVVYENAKAGTAYVVESKLKVMLEQDYLSMEKHSASQGGLAVSEWEDPHRAEGPMKRQASQPVNASSLGSQIVREIVIPELTKEVNEGKNFAQLRQVYNSLILATWYKKKIKDSILSKVYADQNKVKGVEYNTSVIPAKAGIQNNKINSDMDPRFHGDDKEVIYQQYLQAFKKGVYNYIKEDVDPATNERIPRKYFSGGAALQFNADGAMTVVNEQTASPAMVKGFRAVRGLVTVAAAISVALAGTTQADQPAPRAAVQVVQQDNLILSDQAMATSLKNLKRGDPVNYLQLMQRGVKVGAGIETAVVLRIISVFSQQQVHWIGDVKEIKLITGIKLDAPTLTTQGELFVTPTMMSKANLKKMKPPRMITPMVDNSPDQEAIKVWVDAQVKEIRPAAQFFGEHIQQIPYSQFIRALEDSIEEFMAAIGDRPCIVLLHGGQDIHRETVSQRGSNRWVLGLAREQGLPSNTLIAREDNLEEVVAEYRRKYPGTMIPIVYMDDAAYRGDQVKDDIVVMFDQQRRNGLSRNDVQLHLVVPFMTTIARKNIESAPPAANGIKIHSLGSKIKSVKELLDENEVSGDINSAKRKEIERGITAMFNRQKEEFNEFAEGYFLTFLQSRIQDGLEFAIFGNHIALLRGPLYGPKGELIEDESRGLVPYPELQSPYRAGYLEWVKKVKGDQAQLADDQAMKTADGTQDVRSADATALPAREDSVEFLPNDRIKINPWGISFKDIELVSVLSNRPSVGTILFIGSVIGLDGTRKKVVLKVYKAPLLIGDSRGTIEREAAILHDIDKNHQRAKNHAPVLLGQGATEERKFQDIVIKANQTFLVEELVPGDNWETKILQIAAIKETVQSKDNRIIDELLKGARALKEMNEDGVFQGDLGPAEMFTDNTNVIVTDFGLSVTPNIKLPDQYRGARKKFLISDKYHNSWFDETDIVREVASFIGMAELFINESYKTLDRREQSALAGWVDPLIQTMKNPRKGQTDQFNWDYIIKSLETIRQDSAMNSEMTRLDARDMQLLKQRMVIYAKGIRPSQRAERHVMTAADLMGIVTSVNHQAKEAYEHNREYYDRVRSDLDVLLSRIAGLTLTPLQRNVVRNFLNGRGPIRIYEETVARAEFLDQSVYLGGDRLRNAVDLFHEMAHIAEPRLIDFFNLIDTYADTDVTPILWGFLREWRANRVAYQHYLDDAGALQETKDSYTTWWNSLLNLERSHPNFSPKPLITMNAQELLEFLESEIVRRAFEPVIKISQERIQQQSTSNEFKAKLRVFFNQFGWRDEFQKELLAMDSQALAKRLMTADLRALNKQAIGFDEMKIGLEAADEAMTVKEARDIMNNFSKEQLEQLQRLGYVQHDVGGRALLFRLYEWDKKILIEVHNAGGSQKEIGYVSYVIDQGQKTAFMNSRHEPLHHQAFSSVEYLLDSLNEALWVSPRDRNTGIGVLLMGVALRLAEERNIQTMLVNAPFQSAFYFKPWFNAEPISGRYNIRLNVKTFIDSLSDSNSSNQDFRVPVDMPWEKIFNEPDKPLYVEIGPGGTSLEKSSQLKAMAMRYPEANFLVIEKNTALVGQLQKMLRREKIRNVRIIQGSDINAFAKARPSGVADAIFAINPAPTARYLFRTQEGAKKIMDALKPNGHFFLLPAEQYAARGIEEIPWQRMLNEAFTGFFKGNSRPSVSLSPFFQSLMDTRVWGSFKRYFISSKSANSNFAMIPEESKDQANVAKSEHEGGINLNADQLNLQIKNAGEGIKFSVDPAMLEQLRNAPGFIPVIINIQPLESLPLFLGINDASPAVSSV